MEYIPQVSFADVVQAIDASRRAGGQRASTRARRRLYLSAAIAIALGLLGPIFVALPLFPDRSTAVGGSGEQRCVYDAAPVTRPDRLAPAPTPLPFVAGRSASVDLPVLNSGTCDWSESVTLYRESGSLPDAPAFISATATVGKGLFTAQIPFTAPATIGVYPSTWRMRTPDNRSFGAAFNLSIATHPEGALPVIPAESPFSLGRLVTFIAFLAPGLLGLGLAMVRSGRFVREFYALKHDRLGRDHALRLVFGLGARVSATARAGQLEVSADNEAIEKIGGPGWLVIHSGTAAVLERGGGFSRIVGPGTIRLGPFERVRAVIDARNLSRPKPESARTRDGIEVKVETTVSFRLMAQMDGEQIPKPQPRRSASALFMAWLGLKVIAPKPQGPVASPEAMRAIVYDLPAGTNWDSTVSSGIGDLIPQKMLDELWAPDDPDRNPRREIVEDLLKKGKEKQRKNGIELIDMSIGPLQVNDEVAKLRREWWQAFWIKDKRITEAEGDAEALQLREMARIEAQTRMIQAITQSLQALEPVGRERLSQVIALRFIDTIESIAGVWLSDESRVDYLNMLKELRQLSGAPGAANQPDLLSRGS